MVLGFLVLVAGIASVLLAHPVVPFYLPTNTRPEIHRRLLLRLRRKSSGDEEEREGIAKEDASTVREPTEGDTTTIQSGQVSIIESDFPGAGLPRPELDPSEIPKLLMTALRNNDFPLVDSGLTSVWAFSGDTTRHIFQHNVTDFVESAHETAREFNTSFYAVAMHGQTWEMETPLNRVGGADGWIATQVMRTITADGRLRRWQWELRKNRRPPNLDCWYVENIGSSDRKGQFEPE